MPVPAALVEPPVMKPVAGGQMNGFEVAIERRSRERRTNRDVVALRDAGVPRKTGRTVVAPPMAHLPARRGREHLEITMQRAVAALHHRAAMQAPLGPGIRIGPLQSDLRAG